jgi:RNA-binding protein PNO1
MTPLKKAWLDIYKTVTEVLKFDMRMNLKTRKVGIVPAFG